MCAVAKLRTAGRFSSGVVGWADYLGEVLRGRVKRWWELGSCRCLDALIGSKEKDVKFTEQGDEGNAAETMMYV